MIYSNTVALTVFSVTTLISSLIADLRADDSFYLRLLIFLRTRLNSSYYYQHVVHCLSAQEKYSIAMTFDSKLSYLNYFKFLYLFIKSYKYYIQFKSFT